MLSRNERPFPLDEVRDLLGLVRAIYAAQKARGAGRIVLKRIADVGRELDEARALAVESEPGTVGHRAAWARAERATLAAGDLVSLTDGAQPIVRAAVERVRRR